MGIEKPVKQDNNRDGVTGRFVSGASGNPKGRPKLDDSMTPLLRAKVTSSPEWFVDRWIALCKSPDEQVALRALIALANRIDGMPTQAVETTSAADEALAGYLAELGQALREASDEEPNA